MVDIRQSPQFANFMSDLGWQAEKLDLNYIYLKKFPIVGYFAKIPRFNNLFSPDQLTAYKKRRHIFRLKISPYLITGSDKYRGYYQKLLKAGFQVDLNPFNPTTSIYINLTQSEDKIFNNFIEAKRRGVRRAIKNGITVVESKDIEAFIDIRKKQYRPLGFLVTNEMKKLWKNFYPENASFLLAYSTIQSNQLSPNQVTAKIGDKKPLAGILMLMYDKIAYYWYASSLPIGKKLFAPTLLVWEAFKLAKKKGCRIFDFEGICDERFPKASKSWKGFTKFKEGFGGKKIIFCENFSC